MLKWHENQLQKELDFKIRLKILLYWCLLWLTFVKFKKRVNLEDDGLVNFKKCRSPYYYLWFNIMYLEFFLCNFTYKSNFNKVFWIFWLKNGEHYFYWQWNKIFWRFIQSFGYWWFWKNSFKSSTWVVMCIKIIYWYPKSGIVFFKWYFFNNYIFLKIIICKSIDLE